MHPEQFQNFANKVISNCGKVIVGKDEVIRQVAVAFLCGGHVLLEDVPGTGKTVMAKSLAKSLECEFARIQFTPDLLPSDITGINFFDHATCYGRDGEAETRFGDAFSKTGIRREDVYIQSKCGILSDTDLIAERYSINRVSAYREDMSEFR